MTIVTRIFLYAALSFFLTAISMGIIIDAGVKGFLPFLCDTFGVEAGLTIASQGVDFCFETAAILYIFGMLIEAIFGGWSMKAGTAARYF